MSIESELFGHLPGPLRGLCPPLQHPLPFPSVPIAFSSLTIGPALRTCRVCSHQGVFYMHWLLPELLSPWLPTWCPAASPSGLMVPSGPRYLKGPRTSLIITAPPRAERSMQQTLLSRVPCGNPVPGTRWALRNICQKKENKGEEERSWKFSFDQ